MNAHYPTFHRLPLSAAAWLALAATVAAQSSAPSAAELARYDTNGNGRLDPEEIAARDAAINGTPIVISPFEVRSEGRGYYASNTMSGTRLNSKVEDLASSLTVVTKEQMSDFAMLNINDVFLYESGTEGTGTFTDFSFDRNGLPGDNTQLDPNNANRIRGVGPANMSFGNFEASGRVPVDPINIDGVEISRGPNSTVFGLGSAAGTVNLQPATANLQRDRSQVVGRLDSYGGSRASLDLNRVLKRGMLAARGSAVYQHDAFDRKPSGTDMVRLNGMTKFQPFKYTTINASYSYYRMQGNRPNTTMPRDAITGWLKAGSPTWDPVTATVTLNGAKLGPFTSATLPPYFVHRATPIETNATLYIDGDGRVGYWGPNRTTSDPTNPNNANQNIFLVQTVPEPVRDGQPLFSSVPSVNNRAIYDWTSVNLASVNFIRDTTKTSYAEVEQIFFNTPRQMLAASAGFFREDSQRYERNIMGGANSFGWSGFLRLDVNERLVDGRPNPYFLRPFIGLAQPYSFDSPQRRQTYRGQVAYKLDLREEKGALRWFGMQQLSGYGEYKDLVTRRISYRDVILSPHAWLPPGTSRANQGASAGLPSAPNVSRGYFQYYVGDASGYNVDYAPRDFSPGYYGYTWGNGVTGQFRTEQALLGRAMSGDNSGAGSNTRNILKTQGVVLQSHFLRDRLVTTLGLRRDRSYNTRGATPQFLADGVTLDNDSLNRWIAADWAYRSGQTKTAGAVLKVKPWLSLHGNVSDSFQPAAYAVNLYLQPLPDPQGKGKDYGFTLNLLGGKLVARVNQYETKQINSRNGTAAILAFRVRGLDFDTANRSLTPFNLVPLATGWVTNAARARGVTLTAAQIETEVAGLLKLDPKFVPFFDQPLQEVGDVTATGTEVELNYNPSNHWTMKLNVTKQESIESSVSPAITSWIAERMPVWQSIVDPETGRPWFTERYGGIDSASQYFAQFVATPFSVAKASEGKSRPQVRKYRANLSTSYRLAGLTDHAWLKKFTVGGALRWEDKGAIGYYGVERLPAVITALDPNRPIYDKARLYVDAFAAYRTRLFSEKIGATFQLNVRNLEENGRLQAIAAFPDGSPSSYRIVDPRQFILTATFDF